ncbi:ABC transporter ATP-binding protein [Rhodophyticola sp. CCM32]|nr:ABC transporter ATP-binding protein [Rhodophyticola sp. CCM32]
MPAPLITVAGAAIGYGDALVFRDLSLSIPKGRVTALCGPNGCGKSTVLKAMRGMLPLSRGQVLLDQAPLPGWDAKALAREIAILGQAPSAPEEMRVSDLVALGRYSHRRAFSPLSPADQAAIAGAIHATDLTDLADRPIGSLSGGQLQRAWLAMVVAQEAPAIFLDEPTNHLDIAHALSVLALVRRLTQEAGKTVVIVLHDLNMAASVADRIVLFRDGVIKAEGTVAEVLTESMIRAVFDIDCQVLDRPGTDLPLVVPLRDLGRASEDN